jgi:NADH dehydrogenase
VSARVVIVGAGFGGLECARKLNRAAVDVLLLDRGYLVLATGSTNNFHGSEQLAENAIGLKTLEDGTHLRNHVLACLERAGHETDPDQRRARLTFVVASGGPGGVEYSGALSELLRLVARRDFPTIRLADTRVLLVQSAGRLLTAFSERLGRYAERTLTGRGVEVRTKTHITGADGHQVTLSDGSVVPRGRWCGRAA